MTRKQLWKWITVPMMFLLPNKNNGCLVNRIKLSSFRWWYMRLCSADIPSGNNNKKYSTHGNAANVSVKAGTEREHYRRRRVNENLIILGLTNFALTMIKHVYMNTSAIYLHVISYLINQWRKQLRMMYPTRKVVLNKIQGQNKMFIKLKSP